MGNKYKEVKTLLGLCEYYSLENYEIAKKYSASELTKIYNGIGPDSFPEWLRDVLDFLHPSFGPVVLIHDVEWHESDGTRESFNKSNERFARNGIKIAKKEYSWWNPRRYIVINKAKRFAAYCQMFGWNAWVKPTE